MFLSPFCRLNVILRGCVILQRLSRLPKTTVRGEMKKLAFRERVTLLRVGPLPTPISRLRKGEKIRVVVNSNARDAAHR